MVSVYFSLTVFLELSHDIDFDIVQELYNCLVRMQPDNPGAKRMPVAILPNISKSSLFERLCMNYITLKHLQKIFVRMK